MAKFPEKSRRSKSRSHFLSCFGFSGKVGQFKTVKPGHDRKRNCSFPWIRLPAKTPPVAAKSITSFGKSTTRGETNEFHCTFPVERNLSEVKSDELTSKSKAPTTTCKPLNEDLAVVVVPTPTPTHRTGKGKPEPVKHDNVVQKIILESGEHPDLPKKPAALTRFSFGRKIDSIKPGLSLPPISPTKKNPKSNRPATTVSHSLSFPPPNPNPINRVKDPSTNKRVRSGGAGNENGETRKEFGSAVGMSILVITMAIMTVWGRLCAILCMAAWFYIVTCLRSAVERNNETDLIGSSESDPYFRKV